MEETGILENHTSLSLGNSTLNLVDFLSYLAAFVGMSEQTAFERRLLLRIWVTQEEVG